MAKPYCDFGQLISFSHFLIILQSICFSVLKCKEQSVPLYFCSGNVFLQNVCIDD